MTYRTVVFENKKEVMMLQHEHDSNVSEWVSQYPDHSSFIHKNEHVFGKFPPARDTSEIKEGEWGRIVEQIASSSGTSTGEK